MKKITANQVTLIRIFLIPVILFFLFFKSKFVYAPFVAFAFYMVAVITDAIDGNLARRTKTVSNIGKFLDPIADKIFVNGVMVTLIFLGTFSSDGALLKYISLTCIIVMIAREFAISAIRQIAAERGVVISADIYGKVKTVLTFIAFGMFIVASFDYPNRYVELVSKILHYSGLTVFYMATAVAVYSGINYYLKNKNTLK